MVETRIGIAGCGGKMGRMLIEAAASIDGLRVVGGTDASMAIIGQDLGTLAGLPACGVTASNDISTLLEAADVVIDFTIPAATVHHAELAASRGTAMVIGTTGLDEAQTASIKTASQRSPIVWAPNFSLGVNLLLGLVEQAAQRLGPDYDIEILEMHHRHKIDSPSGTALGLGRAAAAGRGVALEEMWVKTRDGYTGARDRGKIGFATLRGGDVVGDHTVLFATDGERLELSHKASDRRVFARGAVRAAQWVSGKQPGLYSMKDVLDLR